LITDKKPFANLPVQNYSSKPKCVERLSSRSRTPPLRNGKGSPPPESDATNKSGKRNDNSYNSTKSRSRLQILQQANEKLKDVQNIDLNSKRPSSTAGTSNTFFNSNTNKTNQPTTDKTNSPYTNFLKKISGLKGKKDDMTDLKDPQIHPFDHNKENIPNNSVLPNIAIVSPSGITKSKSQKKGIIFTDDRADLPKVEISEKVTLSLKGGKEDSRQQRDDSKSSNSPKETERYSSKQVADEPLNSK
jgi:hypothetical protein